MGHNACAIIAASPGASAAGMRVSRRGTSHSFDYARREIFRAEQEVKVNALPSLPPEIVIDLRRLADDSE